MSALQDQDIPLDSENLNLPESSEHNFVNNAIGHKRFKCHICEDSECSLSSICEDAITVKIFIFSIQHLKFTLHLFLEYKSTSSFCFLVLEVQGERK